MEDWHTTKTLSTVQTAVCPQGSLVFRSINVVKALSQRGKAALPWRIWKRSEWQSVPPCSFPMGISGVPKAQVTAWGCTVVSVRARMCLGLMTHVRLSWALNSAKEMLCFQSYFFFCLSKLNFLHLLGKITLFRECCQNNNNKMCVGLNTTSLKNLMMASGQWEELRRGIFKMQKTSQMEVHVYYKYCAFSSSCLTCLIATPSPSLSHSLATDLQSLTLIPLSDHRLQAYQRCHTHQMCHYPLPQYTHYTNSFSIGSSEGSELLQDSEYQDMPIYYINAIVFYKTRHIFLYL